MEKILSKINTLVNSSSPESAAQEKSFEETSRVLDQKTAENNERELKGFARLEFEKYKMASKDGEKKYDTIEAYIADNKEKLLKQMTRERAEKKLLKEILEKMQRTDINLN